MSLTPMEQLIAFCDWEEKHNPGKRHVAKWALDEIERLRAALSQEPEQPAAESGLRVPESLRSAAERAIATMEMAEWELWEWAAYSKRNHMRLAEERAWKHTEETAFERARDRVERLCKVGAELKAALDALPHTAAALILEVSTVSTTKNGE